MKLRTVKGGEKKKAEIRVISSGKGEREMRVTRVRRRKWEGNQNRESVAANIFFWDQVGTQNNI